jgi:hypothetical protein
MKLNLTLSQSHIIWNMKLLAATFTLLFMTFISGDDAVAREWNGIVTLHSTRADVERRLGTPTKSSAFGSYYSLPDEVVVVRFQNHTCDDHLGQHGVGWNVAQGTVTHIGVIPKRDYREDRFVSGSDFKVEYLDSGFVYYSNDNDGLTVETLNGTVTLLTYSPTAKEEHLQCPLVQKCCLDLFPRFDEYADLSFEDQIVRLDNCLIQMNEMLGRGAIIIYGDSPSARNTLMKRAARAKRYLERKRGLEAHRLLIVDGGYKERTITAIDLYTIGGEVSRIHIFPQQDPRATASDKLLHLTPR